MDTAGGGITDWCFHCVWSTPAGPLLLSVVDGGRYHEQQQQQQRAVNYAISREAATSSIDWRSMYPWVSLELYVRRTVGSIQWIVPPPVRPPRDNQCRKIYRRWFIKLQQQRDGSFLRIVSSRMCTNASTNSTCWAFSSQLSFKFVRLNASIRCSLKCAAAQTKFSKMTMFLYEMFRDYSQDLSALIWQRFMPSQPLTVPEAFCNPICPWINE